MSSGAFSILLVEDSADDALLLQRAFRKLGMEERIQVLPDGEKAVAYLAGEGDYRDRLLYPLPGLMLLDLKLPRRSGFEVLEWLRLQPGLKRLPVVVLTGSRESSDVDRAADLGANSYLVKPVGFEALQSVVQTLHLYWLRFNESPRLGMP
ncbi:MAG TPA: response regulator [Thermoanaerobaculia bacterium]|nr:response regulator [Thermoanaerobaculia bacterium]